MKFCFTIAALLVAACLFVPCHSSHPKHGLRRPLIKPGRCPKHFQSFAPLKPCHHDRDCPGADKCCAFGHGFGCAPPAPTFYGCPHPGKYGICIEECSKGRGCRHGQICCFNGCGHQCMRPVPGGK